MGAIEGIEAIAKVREEVDEIRNRIQALESLSDLRRDNRRSVIIGETIMRLLLKLDAIQVCLFLILSASPLSCAICLLCWLKMIRLLRVLDINLDFKFIKLYVQWIAYA